MPELDVWTRAPSTEEKQAAIDSFALGLISNYAAYFCDNHGVIVYWSNSSMVMIVWSYIFIEFYKDLKHL